MNYSVLVFQPNSKKPETVQIEAENPSHARKRVIESRPDVCFFIQLWRWQIRRLKRGFRLKVQPIPQPKQDSRGPEYDRYCDFMRDMDWSDRTMSYAEYCDRFPTPVRKF